MTRGQAVRRDVRGLVPPVAAVGAVVGVIIALLALNNRPTPNAGPTVEQGDDRTTVITGQTSPPPTSTPPSTTPSPTPTPTAQQPTGQPAPAAKPPVDVLNNSTRTGLAHHVAGQVAATGWPVDVIGNFRGQIAMTTLYYAAGQRQSAQRLAREMSAIRRVLPRFSGLPGSGLTLVVTRDWPS